MRVRVVWWELDGSETTIQALREYVRDESVDAFSQIDGLRLKLWIADEDRNRWGAEGDRNRGGAVYLWESEDAREQPLPSRARELIGKDPDFAESFELEASIEGGSQGPLSRLGAAFAGS